MLSEEQPIPTGRRRGEEEDVEDMAPCARCGDLIRPRSEVVAEVGELCLTCKAAERRARTVIAMIRGSMVKEKPRRGGR